MSVYVNMYCLYDLTREKWKVESPLCQPFVFCIDIPIKIKMDVIERKLILLTTHDFQYFTKECLASSPIKTPHRLIQQLIN